MPTYGRISRYGLVAYASSLDHIGPFARTVRDVAELLSVMAGRDAMDSTSAAVAVPDYAAQLHGSVKGFRIGVPREYFAEGLSAAVRGRIEAGLQVLGGLGCEIVDITLPHTEYAVACYYIIATAEASANLARYDGVRYGYRVKDAATLSEMYRKTRREGFGTEIKRRIMLGTYVLSAGYYDAYYRKAQRVRALIAEDFRRVFDSGVHLLLTPTTPTPAFKAGEKTEDPVAMYLADVFVCPMSLAGLPALSLPVGRSEGLPIGAQLVAPHFEEERLLAAAQVLERSLAPHAEVR
jgi:aspartyl-tRNA(Asn)/glutamyl-tRNA(Gln) amidotransferase subunit A